MGVEVCAADIGGHLHTVCTKGTTCQCSLLCSDIVLCLMCDVSASFTPVRGTTCQCSLLCSDIVLCLICDVSARFTPARKTTCQCSLLCSDIVLCLMCDVSARFTPAWGTTCQCSLLCSDIVLCLMCDVSARFTPVRRRSQSTVWCSVFVPAVRCLCHVWKMMMRCCTGTSATQRTRMMSRAQSSLISS